MNNVYNVAIVPDDIAAVVNGITVPARSGYSFKGLIISCEADCFVQIKLNINTIFSGFITGSVQTLFVDFSASPYGLISADTVTVLALQADPLTPPAPYAVYSTLLVEQL